MQWYFIFVTPTAQSDGNSIVLITVNCAPLMPASNAIMMPVFSPNGNTQGGYQYNSLANEPIYITTSLQDSSIPTGSFQIRQHKMAGVDQPAGASIGYNVIFNWAIPSV